LAFPPTAVLNCLDLVRHRSSPFIFLELLVYLYLKSIFYGKSSQSILRFISLKTTVFVASNASGAQSNCCPRVTQRDAPE
jgi:hypothetical protein